MMKNLIFLVAVLFCFACNSVDKKDKNPDAQNDNWLSLFNGKNLNGWTPKFNKYKSGENFKNTFQVEDGVLKVNYVEYDSFDREFGHLFYKDKFSHYRLKLQYRFVGKQVKNGPGWAFKNSGLMFHCQAPETMLVNQEFPVCLEAQFLGGNESEDRPTLNLCTPATNVVMGDTLTTKHCMDSSSKTFHGEEWVTAEILVLGDSLIQHFVNGTIVLEYKKPQIGGKYIPEGYPKPEGTPVAEGYISLQAESHPVEFRNIELLDLSQ
jgi:3-keto-disaccharide hydrolase